MTALEIVQVWVAVAALGCGVLSFLMFLFGGFQALGAVAKAPSTQMQAQVLESGVSIGNVTDLVKALTSLTDGLAKAGPALWALIASVLYLSVAAVAAGILHDPPAAVASSRAADGSRTAGTPAGDDDGNLPVH